MDGDRIEEYIDRLLDALEGIRAELAGLDALQSDATSPDPWPAIATIVLAFLAAAVAAFALVVAWRALGVVTAMREERALAGRRRDRAEFAGNVRRYSELLGVEAVTGRQAARGETAASLRSGLEHRLGIDREPGALELLEEVADSRAGFDDLPRDARASANGLAAMSAEWSIDRWVDDPELWLRDHRERHRLRQLAARAPDADPEPVDGDTRLI